MRKKKKWLVLFAVCSLLMPVAAKGEGLKENITEMNDMVVLGEDTDVLDYPGRKEGTMIGEVLEGEEIFRTGLIEDSWSRILYEDENGKQQVGYIPCAALKVPEEDAASTATSDGSVEAGIIHKSSGKGIFAEAVEGVTLTGEVVQEGVPMLLSGEHSLLSLGQFRITHYCQCSICCGPWANGITSTGVTATTNRTIAVDPTVIPYGSKVVINGQIYIAEDCGGAIKNNRIDIYMGSHAEAENSGVFETEVYLLEDENSQSEEEPLENDEP